MANVKPIPDGYHSVTPYLYIDGAARALEFYKQAFGATEVMRLDAPGGKIGHAEIKIGDSHIMLADEFPDMGARSPSSLGGSAVGLMVYTPDVDAVVERAVKAGAKLEHAVEEKFYGDRMGGIVDPFGHRWYVATHIEDVPPDEMAKRAAAAMSGSQSPA
ncbi:MAG: VOC family protein [Pirellulales bacterium]